MAASASSGSTSSAGGGSSVAVAVGAVLIGVALPLMVADPEQLGRVRLALILLVGAASLSLPAGLSGTLLEGLSRFDLLNLRQTVLKLQNFLFGFLI